MPTTVFNDSSLTFLPPQWSASQQYQIGLQYPSGVSSGNASSPGSSSSASSSSSTIDNSQSPARSPDTTTNDYVPNIDKPYLQIIEEPVDKFRFRYKTEMQGTHGAILGINSQPKLKSFPKVKLCNYKQSRLGEKVFVRCSLFTTDEAHRMAHVHQLVCKCRKGNEVLDPHDIPINAPDYCAELKNFTVFYTKKTKQLEVLLEKKLRHAKMNFSDNRQVRMVNSKQLRATAEEELAKMDLDKVCLRFDVLMDGGQGQYVPICSSVYSRNINNMKSPQHNELKICRVSKTMGSCAGNEEVFIFVEKVVKENIKVKFYFEDDQNGISWTDYAKFTPSTDVHHQFGIVFQTPPYRDQNIKENVVVQFQLQRRSDGAVSEPKQFEYTPSPNRIRELARKRPRIDDAPLFPTTLNAFRIQKNPMAVAPATIPPESHITELSNLNLDEDKLFEFSSEELQNLLRDFEQDAMDKDDGGSLTSSISSFDQLLSSIPSADSDAVRQFMSNSRFLEWAKLNGQEEVAQQLRFDQENSTANADHEMFVFDGALPQNRVPAEMGKECPEVAQMDNSNDNVFEAEHQSLQITNHTSKKNTTEHQMEEPIRCMEQFRLKDNKNIVERTERALNKLLLLIRHRKINEKCCQAALKRLFSYSVGRLGDSILHVLAATDTLPLPPQAIKFLNVLKMYQVNKTVLKQVNEDGEPALVVAARCGLPEMVTLLLEAGADVNARGQEQNTASHLAVLRAERDMDCLVALNRFHPDLTLYNQDGLTVLHLAVIKRKLNIITSLLVKSEDASHSSNLINRRDRKQGNTPLHIAVLKRYVDVVNLLLMFNGEIDVNLSNFDDKTPLAYVAEETDQDAKEIQKKLLAQEADQSLVDPKEELKDEADSDIDVSVAEDEDVDESLSAYAKEWGDTGLFDKQTISKLCPLLDKHGDWKELAQRLRYKDSEIECCSNYWTPSLLAFKLAAINKPEVTAQRVREELSTMSTRVQCGAKYIDDMLLNKICFG